MVYHCSHEKMRMSGFTRMLHEFCPMMAVWNFFMGGGGGGGCSPLSPMGRTLMAICSSKLPVCRETDVFGYIKFG